MAITLVNGDYIQVRIGCHLAGQSGINTVYYQCLAAVGAPTTAHVAANLDTALAPLYKAEMTNLAKYYGVRVQRVAPGIPSISVQSTLATGDGTGGTQPIPGVISGVISSLTDLAGVKYRGRVFIPFPDETDSDTTFNQPDGDYVASLIPIGEVLYQGRVVVDGANSVTLAPVVYHRLSKTGTLITGFRASPKWGTQRKRGGYGQSNTYPPF